MLKILKTKPLSAKENMEMDDLLLKSLDQSDGPILHFYDWKKDALTYGYFVKPEKLLDFSELKKRDMDIARRPTGGGIVFHTWDLAFSFLMPHHNANYYPNSLENYRFVNEIVKMAVMDLFDLHDVELIENDFDAAQDLSHFCMAKPTKYDVVLNGKKIAGAAQRRKRTGYLHQGTISLASPREEVLTNVLLTQDEVKKAMQSYSFAPLKGNWSRKELLDLREHVKDSLHKSFQNAL